MHFLAVAGGTIRVAASDFDDSPPSPVRSWNPPKLREYESDLATNHFEEKRNGSTVQIDAEKVYDLPELIDIAERTNPQTRIAWERARQAAAAVGLNRSAYYPYLAASAAASYERAFLPFPTLTQCPGPSQVSVTRCKAFARFDVERESPPGGLGAS